MSFTIKELELLSGVKAHTIRIWEQRYGFIKPARTTTNIRRYSNEELKTLLTVALLNRHGYKISRIDEMTEEQRDQAALDLPGEASDERKVNELIHYMIQLEIETFEKIINKIISERGLDECITNIIFRFLEKTGILWHTEKINPGHEHIVSNLIRQKIISATDQLQISRKKNILFLLLLPEYEYHELGLLFVQYILKKKGFQVIYMGAATPLPDANYVIDLKKPDYIYIHLTSVPVKLNLERYISRLSIPTDSQLLLSGSAMQTRKFKRKKTVVFNTLKELLNFLSSVNPVT